MKTTLIATYNTKRGNLAMEVFKSVSPSGSVSYRYSGKAGAGCAKTLESLFGHMQATFKRLVHVSGEKVHELAK